MKLKKACIIGGDSVIGQQLYRALCTLNINCTTSTRHQKENNPHQFYFDLSDTDSITNLQTSFDLVIICAGITSIKACEENPELSYKVNVENTVKLSQYFNNKNIPVLFTSSYRAFDPSTHYGLQKKEVEDALLQLLPQNIIVRISKVLASNNPLFYSWINSLKNTQAIYPYSDLFFSPISLKFLTSSLLKIIEHPDQSEIWNISSNASISYSEAILYMAKKLNLNDSLIIPTASDQASDHTQKFYPSNFKNKLEISVESPWNALDNFLSSSNLKKI